MKRLIALVVALFIIVSVFSGCGGKDSAETIKIGAIGSITGDADIYGQAIENGCRIAVDEINANGGIGGRKIEFKFADDANDPKKAVNAYAELMEWEMDVLVGAMTTGSCAEVALEANEDRVFTITPSASSPEITKDKDNVFQMCLSDEAQSVDSANYISENMAGKSIAIIYRNDDAYSQGIRDKFVAKANENKLNIVYEGTFTEHSANDFSVQLTMAKTAKADLIFLPVYYRPATVILAQAKTMGYDPDFFGVDGMDGILSMENFDTTLAEGITLVTSFLADSEDESTVDFVKKYEEKFKKKPIRFAADGYDCIYAIKAAYEKGECTSSMSRSELCGALAKAMKNLSFDGLTGKGIKWSESGAAEKQSVVVVIENGKYVPANKIKESGEETAEQTTGETTSDTAEQTNG